MAKIVMEVSDELWKNRKDIQRGSIVEHGILLAFKNATNIVPKISKDTIESITQLAQDYENYSFCLAHEEALELYNLLKVTYNNECLDILNNINKYRGDTN